MVTPFNPLNHPVLFDQPRRLTCFSAWHEHIPTAMLLMDLLRPDLFVELGTHYGDSYCAFCQAVEKLGLATRCYAVDTWQGDAQTGFYGPEVLSNLRSHHDPAYSNFSTLIQSTFDEALRHYSDGSVDLLHIDGYHTYEAASHDFECWFPKLSSRGVVLFHDINVRERDYGVWRLWDELALKYQHLEFVHGHGLGVLAVGKDQPSSFGQLLAASAEDKLVLSSLVFQLGHRLEMQARYAAQEADRNQTTIDQQEQLANKEKALQSLTTELAESGRTILSLTTQLGESGRTIQSLRQTVKEQTEHLDALVARVDFLTGSVSELRELLLDAHNQLVERDNQIQRLSHEGIAPSHGTASSGINSDYQKLVAKIHQLVNEALPRRAKVIVVSKGDEALLELNGRKGWHFPQTANGDYAGYHPADSAAAITHLEALRAGGGEYLLFPKTSLWWLDYYGEFRQHLDGHYRKLTTDDAICRIYSLQERKPRRGSSARKQVKVRRGNEMAGR